jgi:hypothetical protein
MRFWYKYTKKDTNIYTMICHKKRTKIIRNVFLKLIDMYRIFTMQIVMHDHVHKLIEDSNHPRVNKEKYYDNVFHLYNLHKIHVEIEFLQQIMHLIK